MKRSKLLLGIVVSLAPACGGRAVGDAYPPGALVDGGSSTRDSGSAHEDSGASSMPGDTGLPSGSISDAGAINNAGPQLFACEACLALHCATYGTCERDPQCIRAVAAYIACTGKN